MEFVIKPVSSIKWPETPADALIGKDHSSTSNSQEDEARSKQPPSVRVDLLRQAFNIKKAAEKTPEPDALSSQ